jgi:hypothetical protein
MYLCSIDLNLNGDFKNHIVVEPPTRTQIKITSYLGENLIYYNNHYKFKLDVWIECLSIGTKPNKIGKLKIVGKPSKQSYFHTETKISKLNSIFLSEVLNPKKPIFL